MIITTITALHHLPIPEILQGDELMRSDVYPYLTLCLDSLSLTVFGLDPFLLHIIPT